MPKKINKHITTESSTTVLRQFNYRQAYPLELNVALTLVSGGEVCGELSSFRWKPSGEQVLKSLVHTLY